MLESSVHAGGHALAKELLPLRAVDGHSPWLDLFWGRHRATGVSQKLFVRVRGGVQDNRHWAAQESRGSRLGQTKKRSLSRERGTVSGLFCDAF